MFKFNHGSKIAASFALVALLSSNTSNAGTIDACDFEVGTDISSATNGAYVSIFDNKPLGETALSYQPATVGESPYLNEFLPCKKSISGSAGTGALIGLLDVFELGADWADINSGSGIRVDFTRKVRDIAYTGFSGSGDTVIAYFFGPGDQYLGYQTTGMSTYFGEDCRTDGDPDGICFRYENKLEAPQELPVSYLLFGSSSAVVWIDSISFSVPEPSTLGLLGFGLVGMGFARRRKAS